MQCCPFRKGAESEGEATASSLLQAGDGTAGFEMEESRETKDLKLTYQLSWPTCFSGRHDWLFPENACLIGEALLTNHL